MEKIIKNEHGVIDLVARSEAAGNNLLDAMNSIDKVIYGLSKMNSHLDFTKYISELNEKKKELKKILNADFDRLAINRKFN